MTHKARILCAMSQPMTAREAASALGLSLRLVQVLISELRDALHPVGRKREGRRGPESFVWTTAHRFDAD